MSRGQLVCQIENYIQWKLDLKNQLTRYHAWLKNNKLDNQELEQRISRTTRLLNEDRIGLVFTGENSRGKTELVNALFFATYGQRLLPSEIGRTTMCPTELTFDPELEPAIRLLPIETRKSDQPIEYYQAVLSRWTTIPLRSNNAEELIKAFNEVSRTKQVSVEEAIALGFSPGALETNEAKPGTVFIPSWRYATINFDHPLLHHGIRIFDMPSLDAYGNEPEVALNILNTAQAICFVVSADNGVGLGDLTLWRQHIRTFLDETNKSLIPVLNKIDLLWDELEGERFTNLTIDHRCRTIAKKLSLDATQILPVSAKHAILGKTKNNARFLERSRIQSLEEELSNAISQHKEGLLNQNVLRGTLDLMHNSRNSMVERHNALREQQQKISNEHNNQAIIDSFNQQTRQEHDLFHKRLLTLRSNRRMLARQSELLQAAAETKQFEQYLYKIKPDLINNWQPGANLAQGIAEFFRMIYLDLSSLQMEVSMANKLAASLYKKHGNHSSNMASVADKECFKPPHFDLNRFIRQLRALQSRAEGINLQLKDYISKDGLTVQRFFNALLLNIKKVLNALQKEILYWDEDVLLPLTQHTLEQKQLIEQQMVQLKNLMIDTGQRWRAEKLGLFINDREKQLAVADTFMGSDLSPTGNTEFNGNMPF